MNYYLLPWKKYVKFSGRACRAEYWTFTLINLAILLVVAGVVQNINEKISMAIVALIMLVMILPSLAVTVRRLHDSGRSGWWALIQLIPYIGAIVIFVFSLFDSQPGDNKYGPNPKGATVPTPPAPAPTPTQ